MEWASGNIFIRPSGDLRTGEMVFEHKHTFDHTTIIFKGAVRVVAKLPNGEQVEVMREAPAHLLIKAGVEHEIHALKDGTEFWCVYAHHTPQGDVVQEYTGWPPSYN